MTVIVTYRGLSATARATLLNVGAKAAFLVSGRIATWERDAGTRDQWTRCLRDVFDEFGMDRDLDVLAHAAFKRFGHVAVWERSPKAKEAWIRRIAAALDAMQQAHVREHTSRRDEQALVPSH